MGCRYASLLNFQRPVATATGLSLFTLEEQKGDILLFLDVEAIFLAAAYHEKVPVAVVSLRRAA
jgi:hypothetical protein